MTATDQAPPLAEVEVLLGHAACLERAADDPGAPRVAAAYLRAEASLMRTAARLAGVPAATPETEETAHV